MTTSERSKRRRSPAPMSGLADSPAKTSPSPASGQVSEEREAVSGLISQPWWNSVDPNGLSSRMWPDFSLPTEGQTWPSSSGSFPASGMAWRGECLILDTLESPNDAVASTLSDILETSVPQRFFLSARAAAGILRRAERRGRTLPIALQQALEAMAMGTAKDGTPQTPTSESAGAASQGSLGPSTAAGTQADLERNQESTLSPLGPPMGITATPAHEETAQIALSSVEMPFQRRLMDLLPTSEAETHTLQLSLLDQPKQTATDGASSKMAQRTLWTGQEETLLAILSRQEWLREQESMMDGKEGHRTFWSVRRLTPTECERLQGFPLGWTVPDTAPLETP